MNFKDSFKRFKIFIYNHFVMYWAFQATKKPPTCNRHSSPNYSVKLPIAIHIGTLSLTASVQIKRCCLCKVLELELITYCTPMLNVALGDLGADLLSFPSTEILHGTDMKRLRKDPAPPTSFSSHLNHICPLAQHEASSGDRKTILQPGHGPVFFHLGFLLVIASRSWPPQLSTIPKPD